MMDHSLSLDVECRKRRSVLSLCDVSRQNTEVFSCLHNFLPPQEKYGTEKINLCQIGTLDQKRTAKEESLSEQ